MSIKNKEPIIHWMYFMSGLSKGFPESGCSSGCASLPYLGLGGKYNECSLLVLLKLSFINYIGMYIEISAIDYCLV